MKQIKREYIIIAAFVVIAVLGNLSNYVKSKQILNNKLTTCAKINKIAKNRFSLKAYYSFSVDGVNYNSYAACGTLPYDEIKNYIGKHFIIVYDSTNIEKHEIILFEQWLSDYNLSVNDWNNCVDSIFRIPNK